MKQFFFLFLFIFSSGFAQDFNNDSATVNNYEHLLSFDADIVIDKNAEVTVTEKIKVYAEGINIRRGIYRSLPLWRNINGKKTRINYDIISVHKDGAEEDYHTEKTGSDEVIYFGSKDRMLSPGVYEYELTYKTSQQIGFFDTYDEFYWNVNGTLWDFPVDEVSVKLTLPENAEIIQKSCYTGIYGSTGTDCTGTEISSNTVEWSARNLQPNEGLTIAVGFKKGLFTPPPPPGFLEKYGVVALLILGTLGLLAYFFRQWQKFGVDPQKPVIYPQFSAPQNLSPASLGYIEKGFYSSHMITAAIVDLAVKGFIKIIEEEKRILGIFGGKEYTLEKLKNPDQTLPVEEINLMNKLFPGDGQSVSFDGNYSKKIESAVSDFKANLAYQHDRFLKKGNNSGKLMLPVITVTTLYVIALFLSFRTTYSDNHLGAGIFIGIVIFVLTVLISLFFERYKAVKILFGIISGGLILIFAAAVSADTDRILNLGFYAAYAFLIFTFIGFVLFQYLIKQPTPEKLETLSLIGGFKMYLGTAEEKTLQFHNPPKMTPEVFEKMLPYAMVLGVDKIWGEKFQNMLKNSALGAEQYQSNWYVGRSVMNMNFANTLNASLSQSIASSSVQPSSSGSGSGGGGFSGGGGGGGGGGGW